MAGPEEEVARTMIVEAAGVNTDNAPEQLITEVVDEGLCVQCGTCVGGCPTSALLMMGDNPFPALVEGDARTDCGVCLEVCPRRGTDFDGITRSSSSIERVGKPI
jgi:coenzyme F420 hydrogenase subunit beta